MTNDEFNQWLKDTQVRFPVLKEWLSDNKSTAAMWRDELFPTIEFDDAITVNKQIFANPDQHPKSFDDDAQRFGPTVARSAKAIAKARDFEAAKEHPEAPIEHEREDWGTLPRMRDVLSKMLGGRPIVRGVPKEQTQAEADARLAKVNAELAKVEI